MKPSDPYASANLVADIVSNYIKLPVPGPLKGGAFSTVFQEVAARETASVFVRDRLHRKQLAIHLMKLFGDSGGWHPANPGLKSVRDRLEQTYLQLTKLPAGEASDHIANFAVTPIDSTLFSLFNDKRPTTIIGERGVGKTSLFNYWTSIYGRELLEKRNITWFRIDATKLYRMWREGLSPEPSVQDYHRAHLLIVYLLYSGALQYEQFRTRSEAIALSGLFETIHVSLSTNEFSTDYTETLTGFLKLLQAADSIKDLADRTSRSPIVDVSNELVAAILATPKNGELQSKALRLYGLLAAQLNATRIRVVVVIDGADNIGVYRQQPLYKRMVTQIAHFAEHLPDETKISNCGFMLLTRPETVPDIVRVMGRGRLDYNNNHWGTFRHTKIVPPGLNEILERKIQAIASAPVFAVDRKACAEAYIAEQGEAITQSSTTATEAKIYAGIHSLIAIKTEFLAGIQHSIEAAFTSAIEDSNRHGVQYRPRYNFRDLNEGRIVRDLFNNNVRSFIDNFIETYGMRELLHELGVPGAYRPDRMLQYLLLDGRIFLNSQESWQRRRLDDGMIHRIRRGETFPNIFWFDHRVHLHDDPKRPLRKWHGLTGIRFLQLLDYLSGLPVAASDLLLFLSDIFEYDPRILKQTFESLVAFGLASIDTSHGQEAIFPGDEFDSYREIVEITAKGRFYLEFSFIFPDWLYQCALDTPIFNELAKSSLYTRCHREIEELDSRENYFDAFVLSASTFVKVVKESHAAEMELARSKRGPIRSLYSSLMDNVDGFIEHHLALPVAFEPVLIETVRRYVAARGRHADKKGMERLILDVTGGFGYEVNRRK